MKKYKKILLAFIFVFALTVPFTTDAATGKFKFKVNKTHRETGNVKKYKSDKYARVNIYNIKGSNWFWFDVHLDSNNKKIGWKKINDDTGSEAISLNTIKKNSIHYGKVVRSSGIGDNANLSISGWWSPDLS